MKILAKKETVKFPEKKAFGKSSQYDWKKMFECGQQVLLEHGTEDEVEAKKKDFSGKVQNLAFNAVLMGKKMGFVVQTLVTKEGDLVLQARPATDEEKVKFAELLASHKATLAEAKEAKKYGLKVKEYRPILEAATEAGMDVADYIAAQQAEQAESAPAE